MLKTVLPIVVLIAAIGGAQALRLLTPEVAAQAESVNVLPVIVMPVRLAAHPLELDVIGEVKPVHRLVMQSEVGGRVVERSPQLVPGGVLRAGESLVRVDGRDHGVMVAVQEAALERAAVAVADERARKEVAEFEWQERAALLSADARRLALREDYLRSAEVGLDAARNQLDKARRDLGRTNIKVPFDALVLEAGAELGQLVTPQTPLATLVAIDRYWVEVALPVAQLVHLDIPGVNVASGERGSSARVRFDAGEGARVEREGTVERLIGQVTTHGRMARLLIGVSDPLDRAARGEPGRAAPGTSLPLMLGSIVEVRLAGAQLADTTAVPSGALIDDHAVWLVVDHALKSREVEVAWRGAETVLLRGLRPGDMVVVSPLATASDGAPVRIKATVAPISH